MRLLERQIPEDPLAFIRSCLAAGRIRWTYHASMRLQQRSLNSAAVLAGIASLEIIEAYPDDKYLPSFLLRGEHDGTVFHAQVAVDIEGENVRIVTIYIPNGADWNAEFRMRREHQ